MEIICTPRDGKVKYARVFRTTLKEKVGNLPSQWRMGNFGEGLGIFLLGGANLSGSNFDHSNIFQR